jgi:hypothetical protein
MASLGRSRKARVKPTFYAGWSHAYSWGPGLTVCLVFIVVDDMGAVMVRGVIIMATLTPSLRSLGPGCNTLNLGV